jgi:hypothetical protein
VKRWCKTISAYSFDLDSFQVEWLGMRGFDLTSRIVRYSNERRSFEEVPYYLISSENQLIGPLYDWEEVEGELEYLRDPLGNDYVPGRVYKIIRKW